VRRLKILPKDISAFVQGVPRPCILREISFAGAKLIIMGVAKFLIEKESALRIDFEDPRESFLIKGKLSAAEPVEGRQDLLAVDIAFTEQQIPLGYKIRLNDFLSQIWADSRSADKQDKQNAPGAAKKPQNSLNRDTAEPPQEAKKGAAEAGEKTGGEAALNSKEETPGPVEKTLGKAAPK
ncbi:MAG: pilus assembly protein PilZ, partial [Treponema sp.]|nr:pilus assembly protein PilZ [Treponema sp.]